MKTTCAFCQIANKTKSIQDYDIPIIESVNFIVITALGQFIDGYLLICPKKHYLNIGSLEPELFDEFYKLKSEVQNLLNNAYGKKTVCFEHGAAPVSGAGPTCIDHAHLHILPLDTLGTNLWEAPDLHFKTHSTSLSISEFVKAGTPYFYVEDSDGNASVYDALLLPCQYGRRVIANFVGKPSFWNWRRYPYKAETLRTLKYLQKFL